MLKGALRVRRVAARGIRAGLGVWFRVRYRRRHAYVCLENLAGFKVLVPAEVFNPALFGSSLFLARYILAHPELVKGKPALDLGCGSGLLALAAAKAGATKVVASDINPQAAWVAGVNARLNGLQDQIEARQGNLFETVTGETFDLILNNPPYYRRAPQNMLEQAFFAGPQQEVLAAMAGGLAAHLAPGGTALMVVTSTISMETALTEAKTQGLKAEIVSRRRFWAEYHLIYAFRQQ